MTAPTTPVYDSLVFQWWFDPTVWPDLDALTDSEAAEHGLSPQYAVVLRHLWHDPSRPVCGAVYQRVRVPVPGRHRLVHHVCLLPYRYHHGLHWAPGPEGSFTWVPMLGERKVR